MKNPGVVFRGVGDVGLQEVQVAPPGPGEILIRTRRSLLSLGTELTILSGRFPAKSAWAAYGKFPFLAGYSAAAEVIEVGGGVTSVTTGDIVACPTPHVRYASVAASSVTPVRDGRIPLDHVPFLTLGQIAMNGVRRCGLQWGEAVVIFGAGLVGQLTARFCRIAGARPVIVVDPAPQRLARLGAGVVAVDPGHGPVRDQVARASRGRMADVVFEVTGNPGLIPGEFEAMKDRCGRFVIVSSPRGPTSFDFHDLCNRPSHMIIGAHNTSHPDAETSASPWTAGRHAELFFDLVASGEIDLEPLVTDRLPYTAACETYRALLHDPVRALGVILSWDEN
jgi:2-desacetyl-2-hydroxyethyl bacteriochlorophyllide A dehydrogenase